MAFLRYSQVLLPENDWTKLQQISHSYRITAYDSDEAPDHVQNFYIYWWGELQAYGTMNLNFFCSFGDLPWEKIASLDLYAIPEEGSTPSLRTSEIYKLKAIAPLIKVEVNPGDPVISYKSAVRICSDAPFRLMPVQL